MVITQRVNDYVASISLPCFGIDKLLSAYVLVGEKTAIFETGATSTAAVLLEGLEKLQINREDIDYLIVSHIHLDHAGGVGYLIKHFPKAKVLVHERGARHLIDPSKLIASTKQVFGEKDVVNDHYGEIVPVPADRVVVLKDQDIIELGAGRQLKVIHTPGHAPHHLCLYDNFSKGLFVGEALGLYIAELNVYSPSSAMPDFNLEQSIDSILRLSSFDIDILYFSHNSATTDVQNTFYKVIGQLIAWGEIVRNSPQQVGAEKLRDFVITKEWAQWGTLTLGQEKGKEPLLEWLDWRIKATLEPGFRNHFNRK